MAQQSVMEKVKRSIMRRKLGAPFASASLIQLELGSRAAVDQCLSRLVEAGVIQRVSRGVYVRPNISKHTGRPVMPEPMLVAEAKAKARGEQIGISGAEAARNLGLSTQMTTRPFFLTTAPTRKFKAGKTVVTVKHISPRRVKLGSDKISLATIALAYLGRKHVTPETIRQLEKSLTPREFKELSSYALRMPSWVREALESAQIA